MQRIRAERVSLAQKSLLGKLKVLIYFRLMKPL